MRKVTLLYFSGCPKIEDARNALRKAGIFEFSEIDQNQLHADNPLCSYSSPSILVDGKLAVGSKNGSSCSLINWGSVTKVLSAMANEKTDDQDKFK